MRICKFWILLFLICLFSCTYRAKEVPQKVMHGINGSAVYVIKADGSIWGMFKEAYNVRDFQILLKSDTVILGSDFVSTIYVPKDIFMVNITSPSEYLISNETNESEYHFRPVEEGVYDYKGTIEFDSVHIPFEYKFIVTRRK